MKRIKRRVFVKQRDERDCGPACLCSACEYFGATVSLAKVRELAKTDLQGTNVYGMVKAAEALGLAADPLGGTYDDLKEALSTREVDFPLIAHVITPENYEHYIVVYDIEGERFLVSDPAEGKRVLTQSEFLKQWTGVVIALRKPHVLSKDFGSIAPLSFLLELVSKNKRLVAWVVLLSFCLTAIGIGCAFVFQYIIDNIVMSSDFSKPGNLTGTLAQVCLAVIMLYGLQAILTCTRGYCMARFSNRLDSSVMLGFFEKLIGLPMSFFGTRKTGEILSRFSDAAKIRDAISSVTFTALIDCVMVVGGVVLLWLISWRLAGIAVVLFALYIAVMGIYTNKLEDGNKKLMESGAQFNSHLKECVDGIETVKAFVGEGRAKAKAREKFGAVIEQSFRLGVMVNNQGAIVGFISSLATVAVLWVGVHEIQNGRLSLGSLITFNALVGYFLTPLQRIVGLQPEIQSAFVALERLNDVNDLSSEDTKAGDAPLSSLSPVQMKGVDFRYGNRELVLSGIDLSVEKGRKMALVGESGSGKTTLAKLILGFYEPEKGSVMLGLKDMRTLNKESVRSKIAYLSQDTFLFSGTIAENIKYGNPSVSDQDFAHICERCMVTDFVKRMSAGFDTMVEERGANLSGGQRQRVALARVLVRNPDVIILDEATSNLDAITEKAIINAMFELAKDVTWILIAHRLSTISGCDQIVLLEKGKIVETGAHKELLEMKGKYYQYWYSQVGEDLGSDLIG